MKRLITTVLIIGFIGGTIMATAQQAPPLLRRGERIYSKAPDAPPPGPPAPPPPGFSTALPPSAPPAPPATLPNDTLQKAIQSVNTARAAQPLLVPGPIWTAKAPGGEIVIKAAILYQGVAVGALEFSPIDGTVLPKGYKVKTYLPEVSIEQIKKELPIVISKLQVLNGAEYREPEACWIIPLGIDGKIVAHLKVYYDGVHIIPDYPIDQEMRAYGQ